MKRTWLVIIGIALILISLVSLVIYQRNKTSQREQVVSLSEISSEIDETKLEKVFENDGIGKWGFAVAQDRVCYATEGMAIRRFDLKSKKDEAAFYPPQEFDAVKIAALGQNCLVEYFGANKNLLYLIDAAGKANLTDYEPTGIVEAKYGYFVVPTLEEIIILNQEAKPVQKISNQEGTVYAVSPISDESYYSIFNYDAEARSGNFGLIKGDTRMFTTDVQNIYSVSANPSAALYAYQDGTSLGADLVSPRGKLLKKLANPDPSSIFATVDGFYFVTKPGGAEDITNDGNGIGYISNSGEVKNIISSVTETEKQYSFGLIQKVGDILYVSSENAVYKIAL